MNRMLHYEILAAVVVGCLALPAAARNIRLVRSDAPDATDLASLVASVTRGCKTDQEKMIALWAYVARSGFYHWCEAREAPEAATELGLVFDPVAAFNVYGTVICYQVCDVLANLAEGAGIRARTRGLPGHKLTEVFYDGAWHVFDAQYDCASYFVADDGKTIVDLQALCADAGKYIRTPKFPSQPFYQFDHLGGRFWPWESKEYVIKNWFHPGVPARADVYAPYLARGHTMHLDLRRGEKLIRRFDNEGKWYCSAALYKAWKGDQTQKWVDKGPHDPRKPENTYANGQLIYEPDWKAHANNFLDGLHEGTNHALTDGRVHPPKAGECTLVFRVQSPYLLAGNPGKLDADGDSRDGAIFQADFLRRDEKAAASVAVSTDNGLSWQAAWSADKTGQQPIRLDLTNQVEGRYGYLVRITLSGGTEDVSVGNLRLTNSLFLSPIPLPAVRAGRNEFALAVAEGEGVVCVRPDLGDPKGYARYFKELHNLKYDANYVRHLSPAGGEGYAVVEVPLPPGAKLRALTIHGSYGAGTGSAAGESVEILWRTDEGKGWQSAWKSRFDQRNDKWRWDESVDVKVDPPGERCQVKFLLRQRNWMSLNMVRIFGHYLRPGRALAAGSVRVTHEWLADGKPASRTVQPEVSGGTYVIEAEGKDIRNRAVTIEVANDPAAR